MHIKSLKIFCDVARQRSFSRAADENGVSQSSASQAIQQLEERLGAQLIDRSKRPLLLTPAGERFFEGCRPIVQRYYLLEDEIRNSQEAAERRVVVASIYSVGLAHMSRYLQEFLAIEPRADLRLEYLHPHRVVEVVENGDADIGIVSYPTSTRRLEAVAWRGEPIVVVCHPQHRLASETRVSLESLRGERFVAFEEGLPIRSEIDRALAIREVDIDVALEFDNIETIKRAIEIDAGVSLLPGPTVTSEVESRKLVAIPLAGQKLCRPLGMIRLRHRVHSVVAQRFVAFLQQHSHQETAHDELRVVAETAG